jgi:peroxiredoxin
MRLLFLFTLLVLQFSSSIIHAQLAPQQELDSIRNSIHQKQDSLTTLYETVSTSVDSAMDDTIKRNLQNKRDSLDRGIERSWEDRMQYELAFVKRHPTLSLSVDVLYFNLLRSEGAAYYDTIFTLYSHLPHVLQISTNGKALQKALFNCKNSNVGKEAPDFKVKDINGQLLSLKAFRNKKYVLLDFWASWCLPCREEFPYLRQVYNMYQPKGLEIIGVSTDQSIEAWRAAIRKDSTSMWRHFAVVENSSVITSQYFVIGVPTKVLIDKHGKIIARWLGSEHQNTEAMGKRLQAIFELQLSKTNYR